MAKKANETTASSRPNDPHQAPPASKPLPAPLSKALGIKQPWRK